MQRQLRFKHPQTRNRASRCPQDWHLKGPLEAIIVKKCDGKFILNIFWFWAICHAPVMWSSCIWMSSILLECRWLMAKQCCKPPLPFYRPRQAAACKTVCSSSLLYIEGRRRKVEISLQVSYVCENTSKMWSWQVFCTESLVPCLVYTLFRVGDLWAFDKRSECQVDLLCDKAERIA